MNRPLPLSEIESGSAAAIRDALSCPAIVAALMVRRGIDTPEAARLFLDAPLDALRDPRHLLDMSVAAERLTRAILNREPILVFGDYDADGVSATCLMMEFLQRCGGVVACHIPHRISDGYGFHPGHLRDGTVPEDIRLIVTVDCGVTSHDAVSAAARRDIDVIVTDHHDVGDSLPPALAVINPKRPGHAVDFTHLAGVGVAFYLAIAVRSGLRDAGYWTDTGTEPNLMAHIDLVALGSLADVVPLVHENRILVRRGLQQMGLGLRPGLAALMAATGLSSVTSEDVAFRLAPPINAAGRLRHADRALRLLSCLSAEEAPELAQHLLELNNRRKALERRIAMEAEALIESAEDAPDNGIVLADADWHLGVLGIVAGRISARYERPTILLTRNGDRWKGSGRSPAGIDLMACLDQCSDGITAYGGHPAAAGITLSDRELRRFPRRFRAAVADVMADGIPPTDQTADMEIPLSTVTGELATRIEALEPFGAGNPEPVFYSPQVHVVSAQPMGRGHCRLVVAPTGAGRRARLNAVFFNATGCPAAGAVIDGMCYCIRWNSWNGRRRLQLRVVSLESNG